MIMGRKVEHHAHVADAGREGAEPGRLDLEDATELAGGEPTTQLADGRVEALDVPDRQEATRPLRRGDHGLRLLAIRRDGLLDQHVRAGCERIEGHLAVERGGRHDAHQVELLFGEHRRRVGVAAGRTPGRRPAQRFGIRVGDRQQVDVGEHLVVDAHVVAAHHPQAHDRGAQARRVAVGRRGARSHGGPPHARRAAPAAIGPSSAAVSLTAAMTASTSASDSAGCTGMLTTCPVSVSVTGKCCSP